MLGSLFRNLVGLSVWLAALVFFVAVNLGLVVANYLGTLIAFELQGYESKPLYLDELFGPFFDAVAPDATLAHLYAAAVAVVVALGIFLLLKLANHIYRLADDRRFYARQLEEDEARPDGNPGLSSEARAELEENKRAATRLIVRDAVLSLVFLAATVVAVRWDLGLFRFRSVAGAEGLEDPALATRLENWELQMQNHGDLFAWVLTGAGAWGYLAVTVIACLALEYGTIRVGDYWARFANSLQQAFSPPEPAPHLGYDADGQPVFDPSVALAYDVNGTPIEPDLDDAGFFDPQPGTQGAPAPPTVGGDGALFTPPAEPGPAADAPTPTEEPASDELRDVIGGDGDRVRLADALADADRYHVDPASLDVWDRAYWEELHGSPTVS